MCGGHIWCQKQIILNTEESRQIVLCNKATWLPAVVIDCILVTSNAEQLSRKVFLQSFQSLLALYQRNLNICGGHIGRCKIIILTLNESRELVLCNEATWLPAVVIDWMLITSKVEQLRQEIFGQYFQSLFRVFPSTLNIYCGHTKRAKSSFFS